jgi:hypothetical protein
MDAPSLLVGFLAGFFFWASVFLAVWLLQARKQAPARPPAPAPPPPGGGSGGDPRRHRTMWSGPGDS